jgi:hypothetical protein
VVKTHSLLFISKKDLNTQNIKKMLSAADGFKTKRVRNYPFFLWFVFMLFPLIDSRKKWTNLGINIITGIA